MRVNAPASGERTGMSNAGIELGDRHNFGRAVEVLDDRWIRKPRGVFLERLFLGDSALRSRMGRIFEARSQPSPLCIIPCLEFSGADPYEEGIVERLVLEDFDGTASPSDLSAIGSVCGLLVWFGMGDMHQQNIMIGTDRRSGGFRMAPVDIECALESISTPRDAMLTPGLLPLDHCGLWEILRLIDDRSGIGLEGVACVLEGFLACARILCEHRSELETRLVRELEIDRARFRIVPRDTRIYSRIDLDDDEVPLFDCEREQLARGDIPYYYCYLDREGLYYLSEEGERASFIVNGQRGVSYPEVRRIRDGRLEHPPCDERSMLARGASDLVALLLRVTDSDSGEEVASSGSTTIDLVRGTIRTIDSTGAEVRTDTPGPRRAAGAPGRALPRGRSPR